MAASLLESAEAKFPNSGSLRRAKRLAYLKLIEKNQNTDPFKFIIYSGKIGEQTPQINAQNGAYGDIMPRVVGLFMLVLGGVIVQFVRARDYRYYLYTIVARSIATNTMSLRPAPFEDPFARGQRRLTALG